jgi:nitrous oxide reductase accessory protein NosL
MTKYYFNLQKYSPSKNREDIAQIHVTDYYSLSLIDGFKAFYISGSDIYGPMGRELIPFEKEADAKEFLKDHKGKAVLRFQDITKDIMKGLD